MRIELFYTPGCQKCADARDGLRTAAEQLIAAGVRTTRGSSLIAMRRACIL